jgi:LytS/YehU family sensor histidine kinase
MTLGRAAARLVYAVLWWGVSVVAVWVSDTLTVRHYRQYSRFLVHILVGGVVAVTWATLAYYINLAIIPGWLPLGLRRMLITTFMTSYFYYMGIVVLAHGVSYARESHAREVAALQKARLSVQAQLQALKMELQPHFLFNTLHAISALMHRDVKGANEMLVLLADMLETALQNVRDAEVTLREEVETVKLYLKIHQIRYGDRLRTEYDIDADALDARVPHLIFQPIAENAIKHGIAGRARGGRILLTARAAGKQLRLTVEDDGLGMRDTQPSAGLGLMNTRERLTFLYGDDHEFTIREAPGGGVRVEVSIPLRIEEPADPNP